MVSQTDRKRKQVFQSTRPVWGATTGAPGKDGTNGISIHAPRVGRDEFQAFENYQPKHFNPRAPCGARRSTRSVMPTFASISIHAPRVGRDLMVTVAVEQRSFQSTRPVWGATIDNYTFLAASQFQSTRPVWGATIGSTLCRRRGRYFNPRAPCGARRFPDHAKTVKGISIHAPRVGRDRVHRRVRFQHCNFNPRAPCGARRRLARRMPCVQNFNPRAPCGARPVTHCYAFPVLYFNPRAPCGARPN